MSLTPLPACALPLSLSLCLSLSLSLFLSLAPCRRHVLCFQMRAVLGSHVHLYSQTPFIFGDEEMVMPVLTKVHSHTHTLIHTHTHTHSYTHTHTHTLTHTH